MILASKMAEVLKDFFSAVNQKLCTRGLIIIIVILIILIKRFDHVRRGLWPCFFLSILFILCDLI